MTVDVELKLPKPAMPDGELVGPHVWTGAELAQSTEWIYELSTSDVQEIEAALRACQGRKLDTLNIAAEDFPLKTLGDKLVEFRDEIVRGRGFVLLRGLPVEQWSRAEILTIYWGLTSHIGRPLSQNMKGHMIDHVHDSGRTLAEADVRAYQTSIRMTYHTDMACDVVGLLCLHAALKGGFSTIVSGPVRPAGRNPGRKAAVLFDPAVQLLRQRPQRGLFTDLYRLRPGTLPRGSTPERPAKGRT